MKCSASIEIVGIVSNAQSTDALGVRKSLAVRDSRGLFGSAGSSANEKRLCHKAKFLRVVDVLFDDMSLEVPWLEDMVVTRHLTA